MNLSSKKLNIDYALVQMSYWVTSAVLFCFATVFLQFRGYSNYEIGIVFAVGNIIGFIAQPFIAGLIDKSRKRILLRCIRLCAALSALLMLGVYFLPSGSVGIIGAYALLIAGSTLLNPLCISLSFYIESWGCGVNFSRARALGSLSYALCNVVLGMLVQRAAQTPCRSHSSYSLRCSGLSHCCLFPASVRIAHLPALLSRQAAQSPAHFPSLQGKTSASCCFCSERQRFSSPTA